MLNRQDFIENFQCTTVNELGFEKVMCPTNRGYHINGRHPKGAGNYINKALSSERSRCKTYEVMTHDNTYNKIRRKSNHIIYPAN